MSSAEAAELRSLLYLDMPGGGWQVCFSPPNKYYVNKKHNFEITMREFVYLKDYAEENKFLFYEEQTFDRREGNIYIYVMKDTSQTLLDSLFASRKVWG